MIYRKGNETLTNYLPYIITGGVFSLPVLTGSLVWLCFLAPLPVFYYLISLGQIEGTKVIIKAAVIAGILAIIAQVMPVVIFSFSLIPVGFILAGSLKRQESPIKAAIKAVIYVAATWSLLVFALSSVQHTNLYGEMLYNIDQGLLAAFENYRLSAQLPPATLLEIEAAFTELRQIVPRIFPGLLVMTVVGMVWTNLISGDWLLKRKVRLSTWDDFRYWRLPEPLVWGVIVAGLLLFTTENLLSGISMNVLIVLGLAYFFQGLAVLTFLMERWTVPLPVKGFLYLLLVVQAYGILILMVLGLTDVWLDFRKPKPAADKPEDK